MNLKIKERGANIRKRIKAGFKRRKPRQEEYDESDFNGVFEEEDPMKTNFPNLKIPWYHFYKRNGFKRVAGISFGLGGYILKMVPGYEILGEVVQDAGVSLGVFGYGHSLKKNYEKNGETYVDKIKMFKVVAEAIIKITKLLIKLFTKKKGTEL